MQSAAASCAGSSAVAVPSFIIPYYLSNARAHGSMQHKTAQDTSLMYEHMLPAMARNQMAVWENGTGVN